MTDRISSLLLAWYDQHARTLPWRGIHDPYRTWVSETMLQQTRVETVLGYYERFLARFPTVSDLASAPEDDVLKLWEGLGYYSRARNLHKGAKQVMADFGGAIPSDVEQLRRISGIGPYTAGAIASIAFDQPVPAVDGNVIRVISRLKGIRENVGIPSVKRKLEAEALAAHLTGAGAKAMACASVEEGVAKALELSGKDGVVLCFGSLYTIGAIKEALDRV